MSAIKLNKEQKEALSLIKKFLDSPAPDVFVLKGYAGTGKTFLMQQLGKWLTEKERPFRLLATTGRAASVLKGKTGFETRTVHGELYQFSKVDGVDDDKPDDAPIDDWGQMILQFLLREPDDEKIVYIIDEASMLSNELSADNGFAVFGSGVLLDDLFAIAGRNKIIFVGDPCQLPPVGQVFSPALDTTWLTENQTPAASFTLEKIERHNADNDILKLAHAVREMSLQPDLPRFSKIPASGLSNVYLHNSDKELFEAYVDRYKETGADGALAIARSNKMVHNINRAMRRELYGDLDLPVQTGDVLLVTQNNYSVPLTNGDFVSVIELGGQFMQAGLQFQEAKVKSLAAGTEFQLLLSLDILYGRTANFTREQSKALMVDFSKKMKGKKIQGNTTRFKQEMMKDDFLNCLKAAYGYGVTCHKSQGGEWDHVYLFLDKGMFAMDPNELCKWLYTAVTRAKKELHLVNNWWIK
jgi:ATP-dependent exoDNAse (exonuclease V) alpha subunit